MFGLKKIIKLFDSGNVCVTGLRGTGKDLLFGNVIARRSKPYVSNLNYTNDNYYNVLDLNKLDLGKNTYKDFISGKLNHFEYPYVIGSDIYISDCGVYFPSQYCNELNKNYQFFALYQALTRQVSENNIHINVQNLNRCWDKIREQSDIYIRCKKCIYIKGLVIQLVTIYDRYDSCLKRLEPCKISVPLFCSKEVKQQSKMYLDNFYNMNGSVKNKILIYFNKSKHNTLYFKDLLNGGVINE